MPYMVMLIMAGPGKLDKVVAAWHEIPVDQVTLLDSTCSYARTAAKPRVPMRFVYGLTAGREVSTRTLFAIVRDEQTVQQCITQAESVLGPMQASPNTVLAAWPLPIVHGYPKLGADREERS
jgi:hypothetical protein